MTPDEMKARIAALEEEAALLRRIAALEDEIAAALEEEAALLRRIAALEDEIATLRARQPQATPAPFVPAPFIIPQIIPYPVPYQPRQWWLDGPHWTVFADRTAFNAACAPPALYGGQVFEFTPNGSTAWGSGAAHAQATFPSGGYGTSS